MFRTLLLTGCLLVTTLSAQSAFQLKSFSGPSDGVNGRHAVLRLDPTALRRQLVAKAGRISLPLPDGTVASFSVENSPVFEPALAARYPDIGSYRIEGPWGAGRIAVSPLQVDILVPGPDGLYAIQQEDDGDRYLAFYSRQYAGEEFGLPLSCGYVASDVEKEGERSAGAKVSGKSKAVPRELRQYDLVMTNTGEFANQVGGTKAAVLAAFNTAVSTVNVIFEREVGVRMNLLAASESAIFLDPDTDPFTDSDEGTGLLEQVIEAFRGANVPSDSYDLGHVMTSRCVDVGGVVSGLACSGSKTRGVTCLQGNNVARTAERVMAHEIAHQFSVSHSWNNCPGSDNQRAGNTAFEPGSGSTIMSYAGACGNQNIAGPDPYYHTGSLEQFLDFTREGGAAGCATVIQTANETPEVVLDYEDDFYIPKSTPFRLTGTATDANDPPEQLTYTWEEYDLGPVTDIYEPEGSAPLFRSVPPSETGFTRYFPRVDRVANQIEAADEFLPDYERELTFRLTARDNNAEAGGVDWAAVTFSVADIGPFVVNDPAVGNGQDFRVGELREITWNVAGTDGFPVFARSVNLLLSGDGGFTFDYLLASEVANTGSAYITVPDTLGDAMRIVVEAADNVFYNMNATDFSIRPAEQPSYTLASDLNYASVCLPESLTATFTAGSVLGYAEPISLSVDSALLPAGMEVSFDDAQILPGQTARLTLDLENVTVSDRIIVPVLVTSGGADTVRREIVLDVVANDFSDLALAGPPDGTEGIVLTTDFEWTGSVNAEQYEIQVATSPSFAPATLVASAEDLTRTTFTPEDFFLANAIYYWRVRPVNSCGPGPWIAVNSFKTVSSRCEVVASADTPVALPGSGGAFSRKSVISVDQRGTISDLNLPNVQVNYQFASKVSLSLTSPAGTTVALYSENCFSTNAINLGFDDDAPVGVACPPDDQRVFQPVGDLSDFAGEETFGDWVLTVAVSETNGAAGQIIGWDLEFCADLQASPPQMLVNEPTRVQPLGRNAVLRSELEIVGSSSDPIGTVFVLTSTPTLGTLERNGQELMVGDTFTQADINAERIVYESRDTARLTDAFGFVVDAADGGYLPTTYHGIELTADAINAVAYPTALEQSLVVFPNPTPGNLSLEWNTTGGGKLLLELFDPAGRPVERREVEAGARTTKLDVSHLPPGVYLLRLGTAVRRVVRR
ncbi:putative secreted protein (Por secretion system target) [Neolewinella xylanilytica]|uniref:Putative secreted protein (Por secretion system target) n=1 Tax=Neolewinella xylanilytica TaxID=1514080 RepID=A0A2S6I1V2_9BACT|nr:zinc-dependent metalloprotease family protein [Neolewinella xylanilytica]PPK85130.1 putative secreted protein (Por secretion system target) [Neolewinella xylanilytica]